MPIMSNVLPHSNLEYESFELADAAQPDPPTTDSDRITDPDRRSATPIGDHGVLSVWYAQASEGEPGRIERCCQSWLNADEQQRADQYRQPTSRNQHIVGRGMARKLLGSDAVPPESIRFRLLPHGKPVAESPVEAKWAFNVAHTSGLVICGLTQDDENLVGVDVEHHGRRTDPAIADRFFAPAEVEQLNRCADDTAKMALFLKIWTLKESFIKAIGTGMQTPLADFAFLDAATDSPRLELVDADLGQHRSWTFYSFAPQPGFIAAAAIGQVNGQHPVHLSVSNFESQLK
ncbi:MAG: 4'-phosphopantetheinyl transferase superfamily protein [Planctomycetota bacterium]